MNFFSARWYDSFDGDARIAEVRKLQKNNWLAVDTLYEMADNQSGALQMRTETHNLEPFMDEGGRVVYWVPEVAPQFPGGKAGLELWKQDALGTVLAGPQDGVQASVYIRFTIDAEGNVTDVAEAQVHSEWMPADIIRQCLEAVRYMPAWTPGRFRDKPVSACVMLEFSLK